MVDKLNILDEDNAQQLLGYVAQVEAIEKRMAQLSAQRLDVYKEAGHVGFVVSNVRQLVKDRKAQKAGVAGENRHSMASYRQTLQGAGPVKVDDEFELLG